MFKAKAFVVIQILLLSFSIIGLLMWDFGFFEGMFGCFYCPPGARCIFGVNIICSVVGKFIFIIFGALWVIYSIIYLSKQSIHRE
ncbi:MAG: hypothetical protein UT24_C0005G0078 [Candidatus Woesebacteria bacterium GW2011_GWB1_39_12]|uniref:Uncharacterized protein n=2 Tax=Candidatus Woeseibacteriota TaxID=1752722 RepID=A0A0G0Q924_9BACT|nr:MAG: hypothetical protein UT23_C0004G0015 [Candidatus Woesebacteria bacterium GW2011_GWA1_39_12]KKR01369.1 MAG: hypothetical protein UT24_C0005G0078 [Candidatus Woesebacteria bacterium GW2011_GWB1_39_12]